MKLTQEQYEFAMDNDQDVGTIQEAWWMEAWGMFEDMRNITNDELYDVLIAYEKEQDRLDWLEEYWFTLGQKLEKSSLDIEQYNHFIENWWTTWGTLVYNGTRYYGWENYYPQAWPFLAENMWYISILDHVYELLNDWESRMNFVKELWWCIERWDRQTTMKWDCYKQKNGSWNTKEAYNDMKYWLSWKVHEPIRLEVIVWFQLEFPVVTYVPSI